MVCGEHCVSWFLRFRLPAFLPSVTFDKESNLSGGCIVKASHSRSIRSRVAKIAWRPALFVLLAVLCFPLLSHAQDTGYIGGTVIDKTGAARRRGHTQKLSRQPYPQHRLQRRRCLRHPRSPGRFVRHDRHRKRIPEIHRQENRSHRR